MIRRFAAALFAVTIALTGVALSGSTPALAADCKVSDLTHFPPSNSSTTIVNHGSSGPCDALYLVYDMHGRKDLSEGPFDLFDVKSVTVGPNQMVTVTGLPYAYGCQVMIVVLIGWEGKPLQRLTATQKYPDNVQVFRSMPRGSQPCDKVFAVMIAGDGAPSGNSVTVPNVSKDSTPPANVSNDPAGARTGPNDVRVPLPPSTGNGQVESTADDGRVRGMILVALSLMATGLTLGWKARRI